MPAVSPWFETTRLLTEIRAACARAESARDPDGERSNVVPHHANASHKPADVRKKPR